MDTLDEDKLEQALVPASIEQIGRELKEHVTQMMLANAGMAELGDLAAWYVIGKAAGATGHAVPQLLNCPITRRYAIGVWLADQMAAMHQAEQLRQQAEERG